MADNNTMREQLINELRAQIALDEAAMKELDERISTEMYAISTIRGGAFAGAAENACRARADKARNQKARIEKNYTWRTDMLSKYGKA